MKKNKLLIAIGVVVLLTVVIVCVHEYDKEEVGEKKIKIGLLLAQTGFGSVFGQNERQIVPLLDQMYNGKVQFVLEDSKSDAATGVVAARKLLDVDKVDMVYCDLTSVANAISPMLKSSQKVLMAAVCLERLTTDNPFAIRNIPSVKDESELLFRYFREKRHGGSIMLVGSDDEFGRGAVSESKALLGKFGLSLAGIDTIPEDKSLVASLAEKMVKNPPECIYIGSLSSSMGLLIKELRVRGYKGYVLTTDAFGYDYIQSIAGDAAQSVVYVDFPRTETFRKINEKIAELTPAAILMYDGIRMYLDYISKHDDVQKIADMEYQINGVFGNTYLIRQEIKYPLTLVNVQSNGVNQ